MTYYNEHDQKAAAWLRELISAGLIPAGDVDTRSIVEVRPHEIAHYTQQHFFAGIGGWPLALRLAGWPDSRPVRTGSCPCQPFSQAGQGKGEADERHLWPVFRDLITFGDPTITFGEQVASKAGRGWLAGVRADLEGLGYAVGAADLCAAGVGAPHIRQRLFWVADPGSQRRQQIARSAPRHEKADGATRRIERQPDSDHQPPSDGKDSDRWMADADGWNASAEGLQRGRQQRQQPEDREFGGMADSQSNGREQEREDAGRRDARDRAKGWTAGLESSRRPWDAFDLLPCTDGKARRVEPGSFPLAHGLPARMVRLRGYGNAIVPQVAAEFVMAFDDIHTANEKSAATGSERNDHE